MPARDGGAIVLPRLALVAALGLLAACAHQAGSGGSTAPVSSSGQVGYVSLDQLVKKHPLYSKLAELDADMDALRLNAVASSVAVSPADLEAAKAKLSAELDAAAKHAQDTLSAQGADMQQRENAAIREALASSGVSGGGSISSGINQTLAAQQQRVGSEATSDFNAYRDQLIAQDEKSLKATELSYGASAAREYRAKEGELQSAESTYALQLADDDKADRLSLRTKLSNLPLDDTERTDTRAQLDAIDRKEADEVGQMRNRDQSTLADLQTSLRAKVKTEVAAAAADLRTKTVAKIKAHAQSTQQLVANAQSGTIVQSQQSASLSPDMQARLKTLQDKFQTDFDAEKAQTVADFRKTKQDLTTKFERLAGIDRDADAGTEKQIAQLQKQRGDLYDSMVVEIEREVRLVAQQRGVDVVFSDVVAPVGGVDLTPDAEKVVESLP